MPDSTTALTTVARRSGKSRRKLDFTNKASAQPAMARLGDRLTEALGLITKDRNATYGDPYDDFTRTAIIATQLTGKDLTAVDILKVMIAVKLSREANLHKHDNLVDLAGYTDILGYVIEKENAADQDSHKN